MSNFETKNPEKMGKNIITFGSGPKGRRFDPRQARHDFPRKIGGFFVYANEPFRQVPMLMSQMSHDFA